MADPILFLQHRKQALRRLLAQFHGQPNMEAVIGSFMTQVQELEAVFISLMSERYVDTAVGAQLDGIGRVVNEPRIGKSDTDYRVEIKGRITSNRGDSRIENILELFNLLLPASGLTLIEGVVASFSLSVDQALTPSDPSPEVLNAQLQTAKGAGIRANLLWSDQVSGLRFTFAPGDVMVASTAQGYADNPVSTLGGYYADISG